MALLTQKAIFTTFEEMLEEMSFDKITVSALVKRCGISSNTFYYHYQDIYDLLEKWLVSFLGKLYDGNNENLEWQEETKRILRICREHPRIISHIVGSLSRERLERYLFMKSSDLFLQQVRVRTEKANLPEKDIEEIAMFCRYSCLGFFIEFIWNHMQDDIDESVDRLAILLEVFLTGAVEKFQEINQEQ